MNYRDKVIHCVKDTILPMQREQFEECGRCLDEQYKRYGNTEWLSAKTIEEGHIYEKYQRGNYRNRFGWRRKMSFQGNCGVRLSHFI